MRRSLCFASLAAFVFPTTTLASCSSSPSSSSPPVDSGTDVAAPIEAGDSASGADSSSVSADASDSGAVVDAPAEAYVLPGTNFAFRHYYLGDTDRTGAASTTAWTQFGVNVDGKITTAASQDVCTLAPGASLLAQADGVGGIDNSWGANIMPIFETLDSTLSQTYNDAVSAGTFTNMIDLVGLNDDAGQSGVVRGWGFEGASFPGTPTWTTADNWPVFPDWLADGGLPNGSRIAFSAGNIDAGVWSSGTPTDFPVIFALSLQSTELVIHQATVGFGHATPSTTAGGVIGGVLNTQEFLNSLQATASWGEMSLACGSAWVSIAEQIVQAQDIMHDGTNAPGQPCDAISIGLGFDGVQIGPVRTVSQAHGSIANLCEAGSD